MTFHELFHSSRGKNCTYCMSDVTRVKPLLSEVTFETAFDNVSECTTLICDQRVSVSPFVRFVLVASWDVGAHGLKKRSNGSNVRSISSHRWVRNTQPLHSFALIMVRTLSGRHTRSMRRICVTPDTNVVSITAWWTGRTGSHDERSSCVFRSLRRRLFRRLMIIMNSFLESKARVECFNLF